MGRSLPCSHPPLSTGCQIQGPGESVFYGWSNDYYIFVFFIKTTMDKSDAQFDSFTHTKKKRETTQASALLYLYRRTIITGTSEEKHCQGGSGNRVTVSLFDFSLLI